MNNFDRLANELYKKRELEKIKKRKRYREYINKVAVDIDYIEIKDK